MFDPAWFALARHTATAPHQHVALDAAENQRATERNIAIANTDVRDSRRKSSRKPSRADELEHLVAMGLKHKP